MLLKVSPTGNVSNPDHVGIVIGVIAGLPTQTPTLLARGSVRAMCDDRSGDLGKQTLVCGEVAQSFRSEKAP